jgi:hypothetical protein
MALGLAEFFLKGQSKGRMEFVFFPGEKRGWLKPFRWERRRGGGKNR